jgi:alcohol dehydrogenase class IV
MDSTLYAPRAFVHRYPPQRVHYGAGGAMHLAGRLAERGVERALLVCGAHLAAGELPRRIAAAAGGRVAEVWDGVRPHAPVASVDAAAARFEALGADGLISVGGGSAHDTMRAVALCSATGKHFLEHFAAGAAFVRHAPLPHVPPLVAVPSTLSAAETTYGGGAVQGGRKYVFTSDSLFVGDVVLDPDVFATTPLDTLLASGLNALHHAVGRLFSPLRQPIADAQFLQALRLLPPALRRLRAAGQADGDALAGAILGAHVSESTNVLGGIGHAVAHVLGGRYGVSHGIAHGIAMPRAMVFNAAGDPSPAARACATLGLAGADPVDQLEHFLLTLITDLGLPARLRDIGVPQPDIAGIAADVVGDFSAAVAGREASAEAVETLLRRAW